MAGADDTEHVQVVRLEDSVEMDVADEARFDVGSGEGLAEERVVLQVDLANGQIVARP